MNRFFKHIVNTLTGLLIRNRFHRVNWLWGMGGVMFLLLLLAGSHSAYAQENTGAAPYFDSEHTYQVKIGLAGNNKRWVVTNNIDSDTITIDNEDDYDWFDIEPALTDGAYEKVTILFDHTVFSAGTWYLRYFEDQLQSDGSTECTSAREFVITVGENKFYLSTGADYSRCNAESGVAHAYTAVDNESFPTDVAYTVTMHKESDYIPNNWSFKAAFDQTVLFFSVAVTSTDGGTASYTLSSGIYTVTVIPPALGQFPDEVEVTLTARFSNPVLTPTTPVITVTDGKAVKNGSPAATTYDDTYGHPDDAPALADTREQEVTLNPVPDTRDIGPDAAEGETLWSAQNPLQNSVHNYTVEMGDVANYSRIDWYIHDDNDDLVPYIPANYVATIPAGADGNFADVEFNFKMDAGDYTIYFSEEDANGCISIRPMAISIGEPFDVNIVDEGDVCADINDQVNNTLAVATETTVIYEVKLNTSDYDANWYFTFSVASAATFDANWQLTAMNTGTVGATDLTGAGLTRNFRVTNSIASPVISVLIEVTYSGFYDSAHTLTIILSNISGTYNEQDADETNSDQHLIYKMPQSSILAGVNNP